MNFILNCNEHNSLGMISVCNLKGEVVKKYLLFSLIALLAVFYMQIDALAIEHLPPKKKQISNQQVTRNIQDADSDDAYPLYRRHSEQYYPTRSSRKASLLSASMPGLGQAYADSYIKATLFLTAEIGIFSLASYNIARAFHYRNHDQFRTGFLDERTNTFLDSDQVRSRMTDHSIRGTLFLITGIGLHVWNILDASKTAKAYNNRRISVQMQQTQHGMHTLIFTHRF